jgi:hypothetical protein
MVIPSLEPDSDHRTHGSFLKDLRSSLVMKNKKVSAELKERAV